MGLLFQDLVGTTFQRQDGQNDSPDHTPRAHAKVTARKVFPVPAGPILKSIMVLDTIDIDLLTAMNLEMGLPTILDNLFFIEI